MHLRKPYLNANQFYNKIKCLLLLLAFLPSCKKEYRYCWECELTHGQLIIPPNWQPSSWTYTTTQSVYCDKTEKEINQIIKDAEYRGNYSYSHMSCGVI